MIPGQFDYVRPDSLDEALRILRDREGEAKILSGGYSLIPLIKLRLAQPAPARRHPGHHRPRRDHRGRRRPPHRSRATHRQIHENAIVVDRYPLLHDVSGGIGDPQVRNWGTIGGSVAHADPASDWPAALLALNATIVCRGAGRRPRDRGPRLLPRHVHDGHRAHGGPRRGPHRRPAARFGRRVHEARAAGRRLRDRRRRRDHAARRRRHDHPGRHRRHRRLGVAVRGPAAEAPLVGQRPATRRSAPRAPRPPRPEPPAGDVRGPADYKRAMVAELTLRSLRTAAERARAYA